MARDGTSAVFTCQTCGRASSTDERKESGILPFLRKLPIDAHGKCRRCGGKLWTVSLIHTQTTVERTSISATSLVRSAMGDPRTRTDSNQLDYRDVPADIVARLNHPPRGRTRRVLLFSQHKERENLLRQGGRQCAACGTLFVPAVGKLWTEQGYCSKLCLARAAGETGVAFMESAEETAPAKSNAVEVTCSSGHRFDVQKSFSGMLRPCPTCGEKTRVP